MIDGMLPSDTQNQAGVNPGTVGPSTPDPTATAAPMQSGQTKPAQRDYRVNPLGPQDSEALEMFNITATKLIHSPETRDKVLKRIGVSKKGPIDDISDLAIVIVDRIDQQVARETGQPVDDAVKIQGANSVVGQIIEVAEASGKVPKMSDDEKAVTYTYAVQKYTDRMIQRGEITREELTQYVRDAQEVDKQLGSVAGDTAVTADPAPVVSTDATQPNQTMSQRLAEKGILDDI